MREQTLQWLGEVVELIPEEAATAADRAELRNAARLTAENPSSSRYTYCTDMHTSMGAWSSGCRSVLQLMA